MVDKIGISKIFFDRKVGTYLKRTSITEPIPLINGKIDVPKMLFILIKNWDRKWLVSYGDYSQKSSRALGVSGITNLPREEVYQIETVSNLRMWLPKSYNIYTQVTVKKDGKRKDMSADILIEKGEEKILFELVAHT